MGQNQWCHFGVGAPPILIYLSWDWDVHWGYGILTHGQPLCLIFAPCIKVLAADYKPRRNALVASHHWQPPTLFGAVCIGVASEFAKTHRCLLPSSNTLRVVCWTAVSYHIGGLSTIQCSFLDRGFIPYRWLINNPMQFSVVGEIF